MTLLRRTVASSRLVALAWVVLASLVAAGCVSAPRFRDGPIVWRVRDDRSIREPEDNEYHRVAYFSDILVFRRLTRAMELRDRNPARNVNALDEVPTSSWFQNRLSVRAVAPEEAARGPITDGPPVLPLVVTRAKIGGGNIGFIVRDHTDREFLVKFDMLENPAMQTTASVVVNRILWTAGYNVPEDTIFEFRRADLTVAPEARCDAETEGGAASDAWLDGVLRSVPTEPDGSFRASASLLLAGITKGGFASEGTRWDDPNDVVRHEDRRELRGLRVLAAWLNHTDMKEDNTLDIFVEEQGRHFLRHYLVDFGEAFASHRAEKNRAEDGYEHAWDWERNGAAALTFGLWERPWERIRETRWPAIGAFEAAHFEPDAWREAYPFWPFWEADEADLYWGAKIVVRFTRPMLEAIVGEARLPDPASARYLVDTLLERRRRIGATWLEAVSPLDWFRFDERALCGVDVSVWSGIADSGMVELLPPDLDPAYDDASPNARTRVHRVTVGANGRFCLPASLTSRGSYAVARLRTRRGHALHPVMQVHYRGGPSPRILGIVREE